MMVFSDNLIAGIQSVCQQIGGDMPTDDPAEIAEICFDASRMETFGHPQAAEEARDLIKEFGYADFLEEASQHVLT
jgi:hypothetical protein